MEKHKCKLCFKNFSNGRALGGHMRSHMMSLPVPPKPEESPPHVQLSFEAESASSPSSSSSEGDDKGLGYGLRENPKRSIRLVDPEFSFAVVDSGSVILQDGESETESSKNPTRRRSKRAWKTGFLEDQYINHHNLIREKESLKKFKSNKPNKTESWAEPEPVSSISETTTEEDVAVCLMMLSRDRWKRQELNRKEKEDEEEEEEEEEDDEDEAESDESEELKSSKIRVRGRYKCETCKKVFRSYQALGGHRASHKKIKVNNNTNNRVYDPELEQENAGTSAPPMADNKKIHECPVCFRVFSSGQALGGHKRTHVTGPATTPLPTPTKFVESLIDLNLPAPMDDDDISQFENSAVSDAEFVNPIRQ
ncbi:hypothetical protein L6164_003624 [Bauhinia variegata]|uniref:Uncharacterized protein n=1 Tax=Bauhinia variegata TaxID=167791 RepID=A0ACB9Q7C7_BAUVA|nr:hypothetical protein L6164_003624 [Bauhinia variegata]